MVEKKVMGWIIDANGARPSAALAETRACKDAVAKIHEQSRIFDPVVRNATAFEKLASLNERMRNLIEPSMAKFSGLGKEMERGSAAAQALAALTEIDKARPDFQRVIDTMPVLKAHSAMEEMMKGLGAHSSALALTAPLSKMPEMSGLRKILEDSMPGRVACFLSETSSLQQALKSMTQLRGIENNALSRLVELHSIGHALENIRTFDDSLVAALRTDLGDWRDSISWKPEIFTDLVARFDFYESLGFNRALTDLSRPVFAQSLNISGLRRTRPTLVTLYGEPVPTPDGAVEEELGRTNKAHDWLLRLETHLQHTDREMRRAFGTDWPKHRLPNGLCDLWRGKKEKAEQAGGKEWPLIAGIR